MSDRRISTGTLTDIADAIRSKTGKSALITPQDMASEIESISAQPVVAPRLPSEYQEVEYIGSRATDTSAWPTISVPITIADPKRYVFKSKTQIKAANTATKNAIGLFGGSDYFSACFYSATQTTVGSWKNDKTAAITGIENRNDKILEIETFVDMVGAKLFSIAKDSARSAFTNASTATIGGNLVLFGSYNDTSKFYGDIYYVEVLHESTPVIHLIPCYRKADDVIGMYDLVSETFYTSTTSGTFVKGADVN